MNIDMTNLQFDAHAMYEEARKLGLDAGELEDYGFEKKGRCSNNACINRDKVKNMAQFFDNMSRFENNISDKAEKIMNKAKCHPVYKESPTV